MEDNIEKVLNERFLLQEEYLGVDKVVNRVVPLVSVTVTTYQHVNYIKECLDGILMQKVDFPYEIIIGDDDSSDGTQEICKEYAEKHPDKIRLFIRDRSISYYLTRTGKKVRFNGWWNRMSVRGKYIAWCEGDDYWIDPNKLKKQVDLLERNPMLSLVTTAYKIVDEKSNVISTKIFNKKNRIDFNYLLTNNNPIVTASVCMRTEVVRQATKSIFQIPFTTNIGDYPLWLELSKFGCIHYSSDVTTCYRVLKESASHTRNPVNAIEFWKSSREIAYYYFNKYKPKNVTIDDVSRFYLKMLIRTMAQYHSRKFLEIYCLSIKRFPSLILNKHFLYALYLHAKIKLSDLYVKTKI